jgi:alpha-glucosidase
MQELVQYTAQTPNGPLKLRVYPGPDCSGALYEDDGHTHAYEKGEVLRVKYSCEVSPGALTISGKIEKSGYKPWWTSTEVKAFGAAGMPKMVKVGGAESHGWSYDEKSHSVSVTVNDTLADWMVEISY